MDPVSIADNVVRSVATKEDTTFKELWKEQTCVIIFLRRFGWPFCRLAAREISQIHSQLKENNTRLIAIGLEQLGVEEFVEGNFFSGEIFLDLEKKAYAKLGFQRMSLKTIMAALITGKWKTATAKAKELGLGGNMKGDGYQNGGCMIIKAGGAESLYTYKQENAADHPDNADILKALGLEPKPAETS